ncbi:MAG: hypothetical protein IJQ72_03340 [Bacilli bacterium]|nr:hypothetical protein [Bacilli bacterium]
MKFLTKLKWIFVGIPKEQLLKIKTKRNAKLVAKYTNTEDIKYRGPLSYRYLRVIAWIAFAMAQLVSLYGIFSNPILDWKFLPNPVFQMLTIFADLGTPLFIIAAFGLVLSRSKTFKSMILFYAVAYVGMAVGLNIFYYRYLLGILRSNAAATSVVSSIGFIVKANVFGDLLAFCLFHFFVTYHPKKYFTGKKIYIFRSFVVFPLAFVLVSYILKALAGYGTIDVPFAIVPFVATKPPMVFMLFVFASLWFKYREYKFKKLGLSRLQYHEYLKTNRNSLSFSIMLSSLIGIVAFIEIIIIGVMAAKLGYDVTILHLYNLSIGQVIPLVLAIPFIMLYSYTRSHKNGVVDVILPLAGIGISVLVYVEVIYQFFNQVIWAGV